MHGHDVTIFEARAKGGGLNEYGIAYYKTVGGFAEAEVDWLLKIGGITIETGKALGPDLTLAGCARISTRSSSGRDCRA
jgi:dihydropyrimidine dehydrogenase (NAD+) subunit PreT